MIRILANDGIEDSAKAALEKNGFEVHATKISQEELPDLINDYDALVVRGATKVRKPLIDVGPALNSGRPLAARAIS